MIAEFLAAPLGTLAIAIMVTTATIQMYWALGGRIGVALAQPEAAKGSFVRRSAPSKPSATATLLIATCLVVAADLMLVRVGVFTSKISPDGVRIACAVLAAGFLIRAVGDFKFVGFFKRIRGSRFARLDTALYSPLCLFLALAIGLNAW